MTNHLMTRPPSQLQMTPSSSHPNHGTACLSPDPTTPSASASTFRTGNSAISSCHSHPTKWKACMRTSPKSCS